MFGISRIRVNQLRYVDGFPRPVYDNGNTVLWDRSDVKQWGMDNNYVRRF